MLLTLYPEDNTNILILMLVEYFLYKKCPIKMAKTLFYIPKLVGNFYLQ